MIKRGGVQPLLEFGEVTSIREDDQHSQMPVLQVTSVGQLRRLVVRPGFVVQVLIPLLHHGDSDFAAIQPVEVSVLCKVEIKRKKPLPTKVDGIDQDETRI